MDHNQAEITTNIKQLLNKARSICEHDPLKTKVFRYRVLWYVCLMLSGKNLHQFIIDTVGYLFDSMKVSSIPETRYFQRICLCLSFCYYFIG